jgi:hypothetical protein
LLRQRDFGLFLRTSVPDLIGPACKPDVRRTA